MAQTAIEPDLLEQEVGASPRVIGTSAGEGSGDPLSPGCQAVQARQLESLGNLDEGLRVHASTHLQVTAAGPDHETVSCLQAPDGAWGLVVTAYLRETGEDPEDPVELHTLATLSAVFCDDAGACQSAGSFHEEYAHESGSRLEDFLVLDVNVDGRSDLFLRETGGGIDDHYQNNWLLVQTLTGLQPLPDDFFPWFGVEDIARIEDVDGDGRMDIVFAPADYPTSTMELGADFPGHPYFLAHASPQGAYVVDDAVALDFAADQCPDVVDVTDISFENAMSRLLCARLRGQDAQAVVDALRAACATDPDDFLYYSLCDDGSLEAVQGWVTRPLPGLREVPGR